MLQDAEGRDLLKLVLLQADELSMLPELFDIFGSNTLLRFLDVFGGMTLRVPTRSDIERAIRDVTLFLGVSRAPDRADAVTYYMHHYGMSRADVEDVVARVGTATHFYELLEQPNGG